MVSCHGRLAYPRRSRRCDARLRRRHTAPDPHRLRLFAYGGTTARRRQRNRLRHPRFQRARRLLGRMDDAAGVPHRLSVGSRSDRQNCRPFRPGAEFTAALRNRRQDRLRAANCARHRTDHSDHLAEFSRDCHHGTFSKLGDVAVPVVVRRACRDRRNPRNRWRTSVRGSDTRRGFQLC